MAHYAWINADNIVINVTVGVDETITQDNNGTPVGGSTEAWEAFYTQAVNQKGVYIKRTSYNNNIRKQYAGIGFSYDADADVFIAQRPYGSWTLDANHDWQPPTPMPVEEGKVFVWFEFNQQWIELV